MNHPVTLDYLRKCLEKLSASSAEIVNAFTADTDEQYRIWANKLSRQCQSAFDELTYLVPWILHPVSPEILDKYPDINAIPTLREIANINVGEFAS